MKPEGWLVRPFPGGHPGFRMMSPGRMPGAGTMSYYGPTPDFRHFAEPPPPWLFVLNCAVEHSLLVEVLASWAVSPDGPGAAAGDIPLLATTTEHLVRDGLVEVYEDRLVGDELPRLGRDRAVRVVADPLNWWRADDDETVPPATSVFALDITKLGRRYLLAGDKPRGRWRRRWTNRG